MEKQEKMQFLIATILSPLLYLYLELTYGTGLAKSDQLGPGSDAMKLIALILLLFVGLILILVSLDFLLAGTVPDFVINVVSTVYFIILGVILFVFALLNYFKV